MSTLFEFSNCLLQGSSNKSSFTRILCCVTTHRVSHCFFRCKKNLQSWNGTKFSNLSLTTSTTSQKTSMNIICIRYRSIVLWSCFIYWITGTSQCNISHKSNISIMGNKLKKMTMKSNMLHLSLVLLVR